jgi:hypothetical protein
LAEKVLKRWIERVKAACEPIVLVHAAERMETNK